jgi:hypothetical protein
MGHRGFLKMNDMKDKWIPTETEKIYMNLEKYLIKAAKQIGWKSTIATVAKVHKKHYPDSPYSSEVFYKRKTHNP